MQDSRRYMTIALLMVAIIVAVILAELSDRHLAVYLIAIVLAIVALVLAIAGLTAPKPEVIPPSLHEHNSRQKILDSFSRTFSVPFMILSASGRVVFISKSLSETFPWVKMGNHYSTLARASGYVDGLKVALAGEKIEPFTFETHRSGNRVHLAVVSQLSGGDFGFLDGQVLVEIFDQTDQRASDVMRRDFIANASHELRTPLAGILGGLETISESDDMETVRHFVPIMTKEAVRMQRLIDDLMSLSRVELNEHYPPQTTVNLRQVLDDSLQALGPQFKAASIKIENHYDQDDMIKGDADQLQQVITNILDNAEKYAGDGAKITIKRHANDPRFPRKIGLSIEDNGPGIDPQHINRLTERFYRVSKSESLEKGGTGLGLAIVKHMVRRHQGELTIQSTLGQCSRFTIWLPMK